jgi:hypothetical protein
MLRIGARLGVVAALAVLALILVVIALAYFAQAVAALLQAHGFTTAAAAAITGTIGIVLALILALCGRLALRPKPAARAPAARSNGIGVDIAADLGALAAQQIVNTTRAHPYSTVGAALAAGIAVGAVPELRKTMMSVFKH